MRPISSVLLCSIILVSGCSSLTESDNAIVITDQTVYPYSYFPEIMSDYEHQTKVGYPDGLGARIWVKGSEKFDAVKLVSELGKELDYARLSKPSYTHIFNSLTPGKRVSVEFLSGNSVKYIETVNTVGLEQLLSSDKDYSVLFYGCFQPFKLEGIASNPESSLFQPGDLSSYLGAFAQIASGADHYSDNLIAPNVKLVVGTGDQVYMDAGYETISADGRNTHPLSAWTTTKSQPTLLRKREYFPQHVELTYRAFGSFNVLNQVLSKVPQVAVWDDHEIRDGWGSQGDEDDFKDIFMAAREGYIHHQFAPGPGNSVVNKDRNMPDLQTGKPYPLYQTFSFGNYKGFAFDLRTDRDAIQEPPLVIGKTQKAVFEDWLNSIENNQKILIISSMPVFLGNNDVLEHGDKILPELADDIQDGWSKNESERKWLIQQLMRARLRGILPILVSGDYHKGALSEIWYGEQDKGACYRSGETKKKVFGFEIVASGLFHEGMARGVKAKLFLRGEAQRLGGHFIEDIKIAEKTFCLDPHVELSTVQENFGVLSSSTDDGKLDTLKLITMSSGKLGVAELPLNFSKDFEPEKEKRYNGAVQLFSKWIGPLTKHFGPLSVDDKFTPIGTTDTIYDLQ